MSGYTSCTDNHTAGEGSTYDEAGMKQLPANASFIKMRYTVVLDSHCGLDKAICLIFFKLSSAYKITIEN